MAELVLMERTGDVVTLTLNQPEKRNALSLPVLQELTRAFAAVGKSDATGVILAANGPVFSAGHNFGDMFGANYATTYEVFDTCTTMMQTIQSIPQVVVARVHALATAAGCQLSSYVRFGCRGRYLFFRYSWWKGWLVLPHTSCCGVTKHWSQACP
jgi:enoyl-CoA hydratase/carnithine racemase